MVEGSMVAVVRKRRHQPMIGTSHALPAQSKFAIKIIQLR